MINIIIFFDEVVRLQIKVAFYYFDYNLGTYINYLTVEEIIVNLVTQHWRSPSSQSNVASQFNHCIINTKYLPHYIL